MADPNGSVTQSALANRSTPDLATQVSIIRASPTIVDALKKLTQLIETARHGLEDPRPLEVLIQNRASDPLPAYMAIAALAHVRTARAADLLIRLLSDHDPTIRHYAAEAIGRRRPLMQALDPLLEIRDEGGFGTMMAELTLESWLRDTPELAWRRGGTLSERLLWLSEQPPTGPRSQSASGSKRIAQVLMQGRVDAGLTAAASGDGGGLITLQVGLTRELGAREDIDEAYLVTRAVQGDAPVFGESVESVGPGGFISRLDFGPAEYLTRNEMWAYRAELERELETFLIEKGPFQAIHLRFADVGTFAAARIASRLEIPVVFTLAPDPHSVIATAESTGDLTRANFGEWEAREHFLFRARMVEHMVENADRLVLLPRARQRQQFLELMNVDVDASDRFEVIAEGVDFEVTETASAQVVASNKGGTTPRVVAELTELVRALPASRHNLPLLLTAGRLSPVKGLDRLVEAWAGDQRVNKEFNLVIVGGNLDNPSSEETSVLDSIQAAAQAQPGLVLLGGRSHREVALVMATAQLGIAGIIGPNGVYISGSAKEEFGLAIVEAMGAGLPVIVPRVGGPATYVDHEFTGYLADTLDIEDLRRGISWAAGARGSEIRAYAGRRLVKAGYSLSAMASDLAALYTKEKQGASVS